eukprot:7202122-Lingulodinium_polyedra.AAC.1
MPRQLRRSRAAEVTTSSSVVAARMVRCSRLPLSAMRRGCGSTPCPMGLPAGRRAGCSTSWCTLAPP